MSRLSDRGLGATFMALALCAGCSVSEVTVTGRFPDPLIEPLPVSLGVIYTSEFSGHEFYDEAKGRAESDWLVKTGDAQVEFWNTLFHKMFTNVVHITDWEVLQNNSAAIDAVLVPAIRDLQYTIPTHTNVKIYEIWMRYEFQLLETDAIHPHENGGLSFNPNESKATWPITAYGKTPTAFLQSDEDAVNLAAVVALRDAGAHFITTFGLNPQVADWLDAEAKKMSGPGSKTEIAPSDSSPVDDTSPSDNAASAPAESDTRSFEQSSNARAP